MLPAICNELRLRPDGSVPVVNSRDVATFFEKRHGDVLESIDRILSHDGEVRHDWFREVQTEHPTVSGRFDRSFDLTRQGFTLLVMGWTGERAMQFKVRYIEAFDAMEAALRLSPAVSTDQFIQAVREIVTPLGIRFDSQDKAIERIESRQDALAQDVAWVKSQLHNRRRKISDETKLEHADAVRALGGTCPCCRLATIIEDGKRSVFSDFDHFYQNSYPDADHTWLICRPCHNEFTYGRVPRDQREAEFRSYQNQRRRLPGRQIALF